MHNACIKILFDDNLMQYQARIAARRPNPCMDIHRTPHAMRARPPSGRAGAPYHYGSPRIGGAEPRFARETAARNGGTRARDVLKLYVHILLTLRQLMTSSGLKMYTHHRIYTPGRRRNPHFPHGYPQETGIKARSHRHFCPFSTDRGALHKNYQQTSVCIGLIWFIFRG